MEEKKFVGFKKEELGVKEYIKFELGKGKISNVSIEYTPVGEKIIIATSRPGIVIGRRGEKIDELTRVLKKRFKLDNPHIEILEVTQPNLDAQLVADDIAVMLEREGAMKFKAIAYKMMQAIMSNGALGTEIVLSGKLPSERAKSWRFAQGFLKKTGEPAKVVQKAMAQAVTISGVVGIKVSIMPPNAHIHDKVDITDEFKRRVRVSVEPIVEAQAEKAEVKMEEVKETKKANKKSDSAEKEKPAKKSKKAKENK